MIGMGNLSLMVSLLRARKSGHIRQEPSFFWTDQNLDQGSNFSSKIKRSRNCLKTNVSVALVITNPTQFVSSQTDVGSERYRDLFGIVKQGKKGR
jgi:hypothetical protein